MNNQPAIQLCRLWQRKSKAGVTYFSGFLGGAKVVLLRDKRAEKEGLPEGCQGIWSVPLEQSEPRQKQ
jgi:hypothetical protein